MLGRIRLVATESSGHPMRVVLYTRENCPLCEKAKKTLSTAGLMPEEIDIDADEHLRQAYGNCVPVVEINGKIRFRGQIHPVLLKRLLRVAGKNAN